MADIKFISGEGKPRVVVVHATTIYDVSGATVFTATSVTLTGNTFVKVRERHRVRSYQVIAGQPNKLVWAKVTAINAGTYTVTVDAWVGGTPTNGQDLIFDGWVIDLPYCEELAETFAPDQLVHNLYQSRKDAEFYGYGYQAELNYDSLIEADVLLSLRPALNMNIDDALIFYPRSDRLGRGYNVMHGAAIKIARHIDRSHKHVKFVFKGKENVPFPIPNSGYGFGYATNYGHQL